MEQHAPGADLSPLQHAVQGCREVMDRASRAGVEIQRKNDDIAQLVRLQVEQASRKSALDSELRAEASTDAARSEEVIMCVRPTVRPGARACALSASLCFARDNFVSGADANLFATACWKRICSTYWQQRQSLTR